MDGNKLVIQGLIKRYGSDILTDGTKKRLGMIKTRRPPTEPTHAEWRLSITNKIRCEYPGIGLDLKKKYIPAHDISPFLARRRKNNHP